MAEKFTFTNGYVPKIAENVAKAASTAPTKAEFDALIDALVAAGLMKEAAGA